MNIIIHVPRLNKFMYLINDVWFRSLYWISSSPRLPPTGSWPSPTEPRSPRGHGGPVPSHRPAGEGMPRRRRSPRWGLRPRSSRQGSRRRTERGRGARRGIGNRVVGLSAARGGSHQIREAEEKKNWLPQLTSVHHLQCTKILSRAFVHVHLVYIHQILIEIRS